MASPSPSLSPGPPAANYDNNALKNMLQSAVQSVQWTYSLFWQLCPQQGMLVWGDGYYNGAIRTRKTVQPMEVSTEEASLNRSEQLKELYDSLAAGDQMMNQNQNQQQPPARRPSAALLPEDLTELEWFYLMCFSFSFAPGVGLPGEAYAKQRHVWLTDAHEADSKVFTRAILAKTAHIQTVLCIPLLNGVVELGTTEEVEEDIEFVQYVKSFFIIDQKNPILPPPKPALSAHSSNTALSPRLIYTALEPPDGTYQIDDEDGENDDDEDEDDQEEEEEENVLEEPAASHADVKPNELLQIDMSEDIRLGSTNDGSDTGFQLLAASEAGYPSESIIAESRAPQLEELMQEDTHYSHTVSTVLLQNQSSRRSDSYSAYGHHEIYSAKSSFSTWTSNDHHYHHRVFTNSQRILKYIIFTVPFLHTDAMSGDGGASDSAASRLRKVTSQEELSANHVQAERRRRERLNERFITLRSMVPVVTKMDKASILADTIEYLKQLRQKIQDLEARARETGSPMPAVGPDKRKMRIVEGTGGGGKAKPVEVEVEVSIIESDALVEMQCPYREGLLLDVMKLLREFGVEITTVQSSLDDGMCTAEMRAKVKEKIKGKKVSITQVKRAINQLIPMHLTQR